MADKAASAAAKERGNTAFKKKTREGYEEALAEYEEAIRLDPDTHTLYSNACACHLSLAEDEWEPKKKVEHFAKALVLAKGCTSRDSTWAKGYVRESQAEFELIGALAKWEDRKKQDAKWRKEDEERAERDRKEGRKPYLPERKEEEPLDQALLAVAEGASYANCEASCRRGLELESGNALLRSRLQTLRDAGHATNAEQDSAMRNTDGAATAKAAGNASFAAKKWKDAVEHYTKALEQDPFDHVFYSNRSACYAELEEFEKALRDAESCIAKNPSFAKGYSRQAVALYHLGRYAAMEAAAKAGLALDASSAPLQDLLRQAEAETKEPLEVQQHMHKLRQEKKQDAKLQDLMRGLNMQGGPGIQMFSPGDDLSSLLGGGAGKLGGGYGGGGGKARMTEEQMRAMARAMAAAPKDAPAAATDGPSSFAPKM